MSVRYGLTNLSQGPPFGITSLYRVITNCDPRDRFVNPFLKLMLDSFSCITLCARTLILKNILTFFDIILTPLSNQVTWRPILPILSNYSWTKGTEHQCQIEISHLSKISDCLNWCARIPHPLGACNRLLRLIGANTQIVTGLCLATALARHRRHSNHLDFE